MQETTAPSPAPAGPAPAEAPVAAPVAAPAPTPAPTPASTGPAVTATGGPATTATTTTATTSADGKPIGGPPQDGLSGLFGGGQMSTCIPFILIIVVMYFLLLRPQRKQEKKRREMLQQIGKNDHVVTIGGVHGIVYSVGDNDVVLKIDERNDVRVRVNKSAIAHVMTEEEKRDAETKKPAE